MRRCQACKQSRKQTLLSVQSASCACHQQSPMYMGHTQCLMEADSSSIAAYSVHLFAMIFCSMIDPGTRKSRRCRHN